MKLVYILLVLAVLKCIILYKVYHSVPTLELKRRARGHDHKASKLYKVAAYQASLDVLLWILGTAATATLLIWSARTSWWLAAIVIAATAWLVVWAKFSASGWAGSLAAFFGPYHAWFLALAQPILRPLARWLPPGRQKHAHTGLYEKGDLLEILKKQNKQPDNRIAPADLKIATNAIEFGDKSVASIMTPRRKIKLVNAKDSVGPMLMDELHKSGFSRFPVVKDSFKSSSTDIIGTLYLNDLIGYEGGGKVKELARPEVYYINEDANLRQALGAFLQTHQHLLIVVNSFEEMAGMLALEDVLEQIIGQPLTDEFDGYGSLRAVAAKDTQDKAEMSDTEIAVAPKIE